MAGWRHGGITLATLVVTIAVTQAFVGRAMPLRVPLSEFPFHFAGWSGRAEPIPPEILERARPDEAISRRYTDGEGRVVLLYVGYYTHEATRGQVLAACPEDCTSLAEGTEPIDIQGTPVTINWARVVQDRSERVVLYWFQNGGRVSQNAYRAKWDQVLRTFLRRRSEGATVRVSALVDSTEDEAQRRAIAFAKYLFPALRLTFPIAPLVD